MDGAGLARVTQPLKRARSVEPRRGGFRRGRRGDANDGGEASAAQREQEAPPRSPTASSDQKSPPNEIDPTGLPLERRFVDFERSQRTTANPRLIAAPRP